MSRAWVRAIIIIVLAAGAGRSPLAAADEPPARVDSSQSVSRMQLTGDTYFYTLSVSGVRVMGPGVEAGVHYALHRRVGLFANVGEGFDITDSLAPTFLRVGFGGAFALTGRMTWEEEGLSVSGTPVYRATGPAPSGLRVVGAISQYLMHGSQTVLALFGFSGGLAYEFSLTPSVSLNVMGRVDYVLNRAKTAMPLQGVVGIRYWLGRDEKAVPKP